jgi:hypothetical protein
VQKTVDEDVLAVIAISTSCKKFAKHATVALSIFYWKG